MGTRAHVYFYAPKTDINEVHSPSPDAGVYVHYDGYPRGLGQDLLLFLSEDDEAQYVSEDPCFLAGRFIVWKTAILKAGKGKYGAVPRDNPNYGFSQMIAVGPTSKPVVAGGYVYHVICGETPEVLVDGVWDPHTKQACDPLVPLEMALEIDRREVVS
jgi:hypothetical protein